MTDALNEQLSACLDGELPPTELDLLLKRLGPGAKQADQATQLRAAIGRYSLIGEALRAERPAVASRDFANKVMAAVAEESPQAPAVASRRAKISPAAIRYLRPVAGIAVAAGVAAVAVLSMQPIEQPERAAAPALVAANEPTVAPTAASADSDPGSYVVPTSTSSSAFIPGTRLTNYVVAHSEYSSPLGRRSVLTGVLADDDEEAAQDGQDGQQGEEPQISIHDDGAPER